MTGIRVDLARAGSCFPGRRERRLDEDSHHLDLLADQYVADGMTPIEARDAARRAFGGVEQMKESYRDRTRIAARRRPGRISVSPSGY